MERKLIPDLFPTTPSDRGTRSLAEGTKSLAEGARPPAVGTGPLPSQKTLPDKTVKIPLKEFENLVSRLNRLEKEVQTCQTRTQYVYTKVLFWLHRVKNKKTSPTRGATSQPLTHSPTP